MNKIYLNNQECQPTETLALDRGLHYGDGFFTTILADQNQLLNWSAHQERIKNSLKILAFPELDLARIEAELRDKVKDNQGFARVKLLITRGEGLGYKPPQLVNTQPNILTFITPLPEFIAHQVMPELTIKFCSIPSSYHPSPTGALRDLQGVKHLNRLDSVLAQAELGEWNEGIMSYITGEISGATQAGLVVLKDKVLSTPTQPAIKSTAIYLLQSFASELGYEWREASLTKEDLMQADGILLANAIRGVQAVTQLENTSFNSAKILPLWQKFWQVQLN